MLDDNGDLTGLKFTLVNAMKDLRYYTHLAESLPVPAIVGEAVHQSLVTANLLGLRRQVRRVADRGAGEARRRDHRARGDEPAAKAAVGASANSRIE